MHVVSKNYEVGPDKVYKSIGEIPWASVVAGDSVLIFYRDLLYKEKWVLCLKGTKERPVVISGVPDSLNRLPVIDGIDAMTSSQFNFWNEERGLIKIGGANSPPDLMPEYIILQNLEIRNARQRHTFTGRYGITNYFKNAAALFIEKGEHLIVRNCVFRGCGNGLFAASQSKDVLVEACYYYDNGAEGSIYEHNNYTESQGIVFQYNRFGPLRNNCDGNNLKDRSCGCVIRYNWIEGGNRQLDLVHSEYDYIYSSASYSTTFVYGNILIEPEGAGNSQICHYGGDNPDKIFCYRKGTLHFYHNTVVSTRSGNTTIMRLSTDDEKSDIRNNLLFVAAAGGSMAIIDSAGTADLRHNWLKTGWKKSHTDPQASVNTIEGNIAGDEPGFNAAAGQDFSLKQGSPCISGGGALAQQCLPAHAAVMEYVKHRMQAVRAVDAVPDIGAFEYIPGIFNKNSKPRLPNVKNRIGAYPNPFKTLITLNIPQKYQEVAEVFIYDSSGKIVRTFMQASNSMIIWDGRGNGMNILNDGIYYCLIRVQGSLFEGKMVFIK